MIALTIRHCTVSETLAQPGIEALFAEYSAEAALPEYGGAAPQFDTYREMEAQGLAHVLCAFLGEALVGFAVVCTFTELHHGAPVATTEALFVAAEHRRTGAGLLLLREAERYARGLGAVGLQVTAPVGSRLAHVLDRMPGYRATDRVFFRGFRGGS